MGWEYTLNKKVKIRLWGSKITETDWQICGMSLKCHLDIRKGRTGNDSLKGSSFCVTLKLLDGA